MQARFSIGTFGIIFDEHGRVLLCHRRDRDLWNLPGGALESGETPIAGVLREIKEETGLDATVEKLIGVYSKADKDDVVFCFTCTAIAGNLTLNDEADKIEYFSVDALPPNTVPKQVERIRDALSKPVETIFKLQTAKSSSELLKELERN
jgi:ADP-ribose pyrophosphatase YjhB (NUDIX family)